jgi:HSP20 family protein
MSLLTKNSPVNRQPASEDKRPADLGNTVKPRYDVKETPDAFGLTVYLPGVNKDGVDLTTEEGQIRIVGRRAWSQPEGWSSLYRESVDAAYELVLTHDNVVDVDKVAAELRDGVLRVSLPKHEAIKPRKIAVK